MLSQAQRVEAEILAAALSASDRVGFAQVLLQGTGYEVAGHDSVLQVAPMKNEEYAPIVAEHYAKTQKTWAETYPAQALAEYLNMKHGTKYRFKVEPKGQKYHRISQTIINQATGYPEPGSKSVHCFVDNDGNVYKSASWKAPAKGVRAHVQDVLGGSVTTDPYGGWLYAK